mmetsp:Transcript_8329/g.10922  ORF Transcript_8329/g.10922 Transcript_8329/m.10922 type:complete len:290 (-) Transcript_8329:221-1090(-)
MSKMMRMPFRATGAEPKAIIFDWDDTILPSSFVDQYKVEKFTDFPVETQRILHEVARSAERCLHEASKFGEVLIITNSDEGWVKYSSERYCPKLLPVIQKYKIISARTRYERFYPGQPLCWKAAAFAHEVNELYEKKLSKGHSFTDSLHSLESTDVSSASDDDTSESSASSTESLTRKEIISFGDSMEERTAVRIVGQQLAAVPKSVMFIQAPTPKQIIGQLEMLVGHMKFVCIQKNNLDLEISVQQADKSAEHYLNSMRPILGRDDEKMMIHRRSTESAEVVVAASPS